MCLCVLEGLTQTGLPQESDLKHLVEGVWGGQSVLSAERDLFELAVVRWDRSVEWSPWNCIVLTHSEADYHQQLDNIQEVSSQERRLGMAALISGWGRMRRECYMLHE